MGFAWRRLGAILLVVIVVAVVLTIDSSTWGGIKDAFADAVLNNSLKVGGKDIKGVKPKVPPDHKVAIDLLVGRMKDMAKLEGNYCFAQYQKLPLLKQTTLLFEMDGDKTLLRVLGGVGGLQETNLNYELPLKLCVVGGEQNGVIVSEDFYNTFLEPDGEAHSNFFKSVNIIKIAGADNSNRFSYLGVENKLEDGAWLFKASDNQVCFFPASSDEDEGIDSDYLVDKEEEKSIFNQLNRNSLKCPSSEDDWQKYESIEVTGLKSTSVSHAISQGCEGLVGEDCLSESGCNGKYPDISGFKEGCAVFSTRVHLPYDDCGAGKSPEGQILYPYGKNVLQNNGNLKLVPYTFKGFARTKEIVESNLWKSFDTKSLICAKNEWVVCDRFHLDQEFVGKEKTYLCKEDNGVILWEEKT